MTIVCEAHGIEMHDCGSFAITIGLYRNKQGFCGNCGSQPAEVTWGDPNRPHERWCRRCVITAQLEHARERAAAIPDLEAELALIEKGRRGG